MIGTPTTRDQAIRQLQDFYHREGRSPNTFELKRPAMFGVPGQRTLTRLFGGTPAALEAAGLPPRERGVHVGGPRRHVRTRFPDAEVVPDPAPLTPLSHQWYRSARIVTFVLSTYPDVAAVTRELGYRGESAMLRRWHVLHTGKYTDRGVEKPAEWVGLLVVDKLLTALGMHIWNLGDPDAISPRSPSEPRAQLSLEEAA